MVGSCGDKPCNGRDICLPAEKSFLCQNSDYPKAPLFRNTTSTGSVEIGGEMVYSCTLPLHRIVGQDYVRCEWMNTWSSNVEITCTAVQCPDDWTRYNDSCYLIGGGNGMKFSKAVNYCEGLWADIVQIQSADENLFVKDNLLRENGYWLGLTDEKQEGDWRWYKTGELATYFGWASDEPNGLVYLVAATVGRTDDEDCVMYAAKKGYKWVDVGCNRRKLLPICELRLSV